MSVESKNTRLLKDKLAIYDGACPLCISLRDKVIGWNILPREKIANYYDLPEAHSQLIDAARFQNEMALIDLAGGPTLYGPDALRHIFSEKWWLLRQFFNIPGIMSPIRFIYRTLAYNRYVVSTPRKDMPVCDCESPAPPIFHGIYLMYSLILALGITFLFGYGLHIYFPTLSGLQTGAAMLLIAGTGWVVQGGLSMLGYGSKRFQYLRHLFTLMRKGVMPLLPAAILMILFPRLHFIVPMIAVLVSSSLMVWQHRLRVWALGGSPYWTLSWFLSLQLTAIAWCILLFPHA